MFEHSISTTVDTYCFGESDIILKIHYPNVFSAIFHMFYCVCFLQDYYTSISMLSLDQINRIASVNLKRIQASRNIDSLDWIRYFKT